MTSWNFFAAVNCGSLTNPVNGELNLTTTTFMSTSTYSCNAGYTLFGKGTRTCQANGTWSDNVPTCDRKYNIFQINRLTSLPFSEHDLPSMPHQ